MNKEFIKAIQQKTAGLLIDHSKNDSPDTVYSWKEIIEFLEDLIKEMKDFYNPAP
jgi:hypothetical protein